MQQVHFILYVSSQSASRDFYQRLLGQAPRLDVPGMTEFQLKPDVVLGLMPQAGIEKLLPVQTSPAVPRCELYLHYADFTEILRRALEAGARLLSPPEVRSWGARVAYLIDPDQHVIGLADDLTGVVAAHDLE
ncbi:MAG: glyoxalase [Candidatus Eremiobacteraeota bacterium]|nr:glyoxalase [Candidatus Eremiobacteraeota bacterium]